MPWALGASDPMRPPGSLWPLLAGMHDTLDHQGNNRQAKGEVQPLQQLVAQGVDSVLHTCSPRRRIQRSQVRALKEVSTPARG